MADHPIDRARLRRALSGRIIGSTLLTFVEISSTSTIARMHARAGHAEGLVVLAESQSAGRGRAGRNWIAPPGSSLLLSVLLRPTRLAPASATALTMLASVAVCEAIAQTSDVPPALKWPNDVLLPTTSGELCKVAGILIDIDARGGRIASAVIGIGINTSWTPTGSVDGKDLAATATSIAAATSRPVDRTQLLIAILHQLDARYVALAEDGPAALFATWRALLVTPGRVVRVDGPAGVIEGLAEDVDATGALLVRDATGVLHTLHAGDVDAAIPRA